MRQGQPSLFEPPTPALPEGFRYQRDLLTEAEERDLLAQLRHLSFAAFEFQGFLGKRRTVSFGWHYDFNQGQLRPAEPIPPFLAPLLDRAAGFAGLGPASLRHVLVTEYPPGSTIGWHRDKAVFAEVIGLSLLSPCQFRLRRRKGAGWDRATLALAPRSAYLLRGTSREDWEHSIPAVEDLRYSITFRSLRR